MNAEHRWLVKALREAGEELQSRFASLPEEIVLWRPEPREWCLAEVLGHVRDRERLAYSQIESVVYDREPALPSPDLAALPAERRYATQPLHRFLREFSARREETVHLLWSLEPEEWERCGRHPYLGRLNVFTLARNLNQHDLDHLWQARKLVRDFELVQNLPAGSLLG